ncbi:hypothetical protein D3C86_1800260 [compost metagenome]
MCRRVCRIAIIDLCALLHEYFKNFDELRRIGFEALPHCEIKQRGLFPASFVEVGYGLGEVGTQLFRIERHDVGCKFLQGLVFEIIGTVCECRIFARPGNFPPFADNRTGD